MACSYCGMRGHNVTSHYTTKAERERIAHRHGVRHRRPPSTERRDGYVLCVVEGCMIWTKKPTPFGTCPMFLWDERHDRWNAQRIIRLQGENQ